MNTTRRGRVSISRTILRKTPLEDMGRAMSGFVVLHSVARFDRDEIEYFGTHPNFDPVPEGQEEPEYNLRIIHEEGVFSHAEWHKVSCQDWTSQLPVEIITPPDLLSALETIIDQAKSHGLVPSLIKGVMRTAENNIKDGK